jgi:hypothetical protein
MPAPILLWNTETNKPEAVQPEAVADSLASGRYQEYAEGRTQTGATAEPTVLDQAGRDRLQLGYEYGQDPLALSRQANQDALEAQFSSPADQIRTFGEGVLGGATFGLLGDVTDGSYEGDARRKVNEGLGTAGALVGTLGTLGASGSPLNAVGQLASKAGAGAAARLGGGALAKTVGAGVEGALFGVVDEGLHQTFDAAIRDKPFVAERLTSAATLGGLMGAGTGGLLEGAKKAAQAVKGTKPGAKDVVEAISTPEAQKEFSDNLKQAYDAVYEAGGTSAGRLQVLAAAQDDMRAGLGNLANTAEGQYIAGLDDEWFKVRFKAVDEMEDARKALGRFDTAKVIDLDKNGLKAFSQAWAKYEDTVRQLDDLMQLPVGALGTAPKAGATVSQRPAADLPLDGATRANRAKPAPQDGTRPLAGTRPATPRAQKSILDDDWTPPPTARQNDAAQALDDILEETGATIPDRKAREKLLADGRKPAKPEKVAKNTKDRPQDASPYLDDGVTLRPGWAMVGGKPVDTWGRTLPPVAKTTAVKDTPEFALAEQFERTERQLRLLSPDERIPLFADDLPKNGSKVVEVDPKQLQARGLSQLQEGFGHPVRLDNARKAIAEGQRDAIDVVVGSTGRLEIENGRHRFAAALEAGKPVKVRFLAGGPSTALGPGVSRIGVKKGAEQVLENHPFYRQFFEGWGRDLSPLANNLDMPVVGRVAELQGKLAGHAEAIAGASGMTGNLPGITGRLGVDGIRGQSGLMDAVVDGWAAHAWAKAAAKEASGKASALRDGAEDVLDDADGPIPGYQRRAAEVARFATRRALMAGAAGSAAGAMAGVPGFIAGQAAYALVAGRLGRLAAWADESKRTTAAAIESLLGSGRAQAATRLVTAAKVSYTGHKEDETTDPRVKGDQLRNMLTNEEAIRARVRENLEPISRASPDLASEMEEVQVRRLHNLAEKAPAFLATPGAVPPAPYGAEMDYFNDYEQVTMDPDAAIKALKTASLTRAQVDAMREQHPQLYQYAQAQLISGLTPERMLAMPRNVRTQVELFLGYSLFPSAGLSQRGAYANAKQKAQTTPDGGPPNPRAMPRQSTGQQMTSPLNRPGM